jgi:histidine kinase 2/3/4 (cytokinin receptor)
MNGQLTFKSLPGEGSLFQFTLPLGLKAASPNCDTLSCCPKQQWKAAEREKLRGMHVVLIDNHPVRQEASASYLRGLNITVTYMVDFAPTLVLLKSVGQAAAIHAVIIDLQGTRISAALEFSSSIRKERHLERLSIVGLSTGLCTSAEKELKEAGFLSIVNKPLRVAALVAALLQPVGVSERKRGPNNKKLMSGKRLLVVDDNMVNRRVATSMLSQYGATVMAVNGGAEAISAVRNQEAGKEFDLILMDIQMPEMDGYEATRQIRKWEVERCNKCATNARLGPSENLAKGNGECDHFHLPIVAVTADVLKGTHELCYNVGMDDYITKPLDQKQLHLLLERFLRSNLINAPGNV